MPRHEYYRFVGVCWRAQNIEDEGADDAISFDVYSSCLIVAQTSAFARTMLILLILSAAGHTAAMPGLVDRGRRAGRWCFSAAEVRSRREVRARALFHLAGVSRLVGRPLLRGPR